MVLLADFLEFANETEAAVEEEADQGETVRGSVVWAAVGAAEEAVGAVEQAAGAVEVVDDGAADAVAAPDDEAEEPAEMQAPQLRLGFWENSSALAPTSTRAGVGLRTKLAR